jgi:hypothetical protein
MQQTRTWGQAYKSFLLSRDENLILKIAPVLLLFGTPEVLVGNLIPIVGELADLGEFGLILLVLLRTYQAVRRYK